MYDIGSIRKDFPLTEKTVYLDNAATTQTPKPAVDAMLEFFYDYTANYGRGAHQPAVRATNAYEDTRDTVASFFNVGSEKIVFTKNTTDSINMVADGLGLQPGDHVITSLAEHHSNIVPWLHKKDPRHGGIDVTAVGIDGEGYLNPEEIENAVTDQTKLIAVNHSSNVFGTTQEIRKIIKIAHDAGAKVLIDGAQSAGQMMIDLKSLDCDFFATAGHKGLLGPQGTGVLYIKEPDALEPTTLGGGTTEDADGFSFVTKRPPSCFEAGTPNLPGVIGLGAAVEYLKQFSLDEIEHHEAELGRKTAQRLSEIDGVTVYGPAPGKNRTGLVSFNVEKREPHTTAMYLDRYFRICVRSGFHCAVPGHKALGIDNGSVRASFALYTTEEETDLLIDAVTELSREE